MTMEQILEKIKQKHGEAALRDDKLLMGFFMDYSHSQLRPQTNALRTFLDCKGNERVLNLQNASGLAQQTEYHRLIQEMVSDYNMQETTAANVCAAFWRAANGTEPPISKFVSEPVRFSTPAVDTTAETVRGHYGATSSRVPEPNLEPEPALEPKLTPDSSVPLPKAKEQSPFRQHLDGMGKKERKAFLFGLTGVLILSLFLILVMIKFAIDARTSDVSDRLGGIAILACYLVITLWRMKRLWQTGFPFHPAGRFLSAVSAAYSDIVLAIHWLFIITGIVSPVFMLIDTDDISGTPTMGIFMEVFFLAIASCSAFHANWHKHKKKIIG